MKLVATSVLGLVLALAVAAARPTAAHACGGGGPSGDAIAVVGLTYLGLTGGMALNDVVRGDHSAAYGAVEGLVHTPIALLFAAAAIDELGNYYGPDTDAVVGLSIMTAIHGALAVHGWKWVVKGGAKPKRKEKRTPPQDWDGPPGMYDRSISVAPMPVKGGGGLAVHGLF